MKMNKLIFRRFFIIARFILLISLCISTVKAAGDVDAGFSASLTRSLPNIFVAARQSVVQPDGKIIIAGSFQTIDGNSRTHIARLNSDGTLDFTFVPPVIDTIFGSNTPPLGKIVLQPDGKILIGGRFYINGLGETGLIRVNADGSLDTNFLNALGFNKFTGVADFAIKPDGKIIVLGFRIFDGSSYPVSSRLTPDGTLEEERPNSLSKLVVQPDGKAIAVYSAGLVRLEQNLTLDSSFQMSLITGGAINDLLLLPDGKVIAAGAFNRVNDSPLNQLARFNSNGTVDATFNVGAAASNFSIESIELLPDGKYLVGGGFTTFNGIAAKHVARLNPADGSVDTTFNSEIDNPYAAYDLDVLPDGKIFVTSVVPGRLNPNGSLDNSFTAPDIGISGTAYTTIVQPDNKILVSGFFRSANGKTIPSLARFNADGTIDNTFNQTYLNQYPGGEILTMALQPDGKIIAGGRNVDGAFRLNADGSFDALFNTGLTTVFDLKIAPDGNVYVANLTAGNQKNIVKFNSSGIKDSSFVVTANALIYKLAIQPDGKILAAGDFGSINGINRGRIARLNPDGTVDATFNVPGGVANAPIYDVALQPDGKIVIGGDFSGVQFDTTKKYLARLNSNGTLDASFAPVVTARIRTIKIQPNGRILAGGLVENLPSIVRQDGKLFRFNPNGTPDASFNNSLYIDRTVNSIDLQSNNKIILAGLFTHIDGIANLGVARLNNAAPAGFDFDGDGKTDISIFRPSSGEWWYYRSSDGGNYAAQFGASSDRLVPGDFTGDGRTDIAVWRPASGEWFILRSEDGSYYSYPFGTNGDIPTVGDFDGDGRADSAVFRPSDTNWYIRRSSDGGFTIQQFGANGDVPAVGDYDGDGKSDIAIWRASTGEWWIRKSSDSSVVAFQFGNSNDKPVQGDYTGDGKADVAIYRPSTGEWFILRSDDFSYYSFPFGTTGDIPAAGDYDGDGRFDATVFRPSASTWYVQRSTAGTLIQPFGISGDTPVPNAFVPGNNLTKQKALNIKNGLRAE